MLLEAGNLHLPYMLKQLHGFHTACLACAAVVVSFVTSLVRSLDGHCRMI